MTITKEQKDKSKYTDLLTCPKCGYEKKVFKPRAIEKMKEEFNRKGIKVTKKKLEDNDRTCPRCRTRMGAVITESIA